MQSHMALLYGNILNKDNSKGLSSMKITFQKCLKFLFLFLERRNKGVRYRRRDGQWEALAGLTAVRKLKHNLFQKEDGEWWKKLIQFEFYLNRSFPSIYHFHNGHNADSTSCGVKAGTWEVRAKNCTVNHVHRMLQMLCLHLHVPVHCFPFVSSCLLLLDPC